MPTPAHLVLASTSVYRQALLRQLGVSFVSQKPTFDEDNAKHQEPAKSLAPAELCLWLGSQKAKSLMRPDNCVIGSDQMVVLENQILGKPGSKEKAIAQLSMMQNRTHELLTSVCLWHRGQEQSFLHRTRLQMRALSREQIHAYVDRDQPLDCAGSYKIEKNATPLFHKIECDDFSAIQGLPLLWLTQKLSELGFEVPGTGEQT